ncbi:hypothetical protein BC936DRAFT_149518, partial [Jimgerdemannia flammicorona]
MPYAICVDLEMRIYKRRFDFFHTYRTTNRIMCFRNPHFLFLWWTTLVIRGYNKCGCVSIIMHSIALPSSNVAAKEMWTRWCSNCRPR